MNIENYAVYALYAVVYLVIATLMKYILNIRAVGYYSADEQISQGNLAVGLRRSGAQLGLAIGMIGVFSGGSSPDLKTDLLLTGGYGLLAMLFMLVSLLVIDKVVLPRVDNTEQLRRGNVAVGVTEFGVLVMTGILAYASIRGDSGGVVSAILYFLGGQVSLVLFVLLYEWVIARSLKLVDRISEGNVAAGVYLAGVVIAYGLVLQSAIVGDANAAGIGQAVMLYIGAAVLGMLMLYVFEYLIDWLIVTSTNVRDMVSNGELVAAVQLSLARIGMALILGMAIL